MIKLLTLAALLVGCTTTGQAKTFTLENEDRYLEVIDVVDSTVLQTAADLNVMSQESDEPITILINSPGGYIAPGFILVDAMELAKSRGVTLKCITGVISASMAFIMLAHCDERYALHNTMLLFHPVSFGGDSIRITEVLPSLLETERRERIVGTYLMKSMGLSWREYHPHNFSETLWTGKGLADYTAKAEFITVVQDVKGVPNLFQYRRQRFSLFGYNEDLMQTIPASVRHLYEE